MTGPGNVTPAAEFNMYCDPLSARTVLRSRMTKTLLPLEVTNQLVMTFDWLDLLPPESTRAGKLLRRILPYAFRSHRQELGLGRDVHRRCLGRRGGGASGIVRNSRNGRRRGNARRTDARRNGVRPPPGAEKWRSNADVAVSMDTIGVKDYILRTLAEAARAG